MRLSHAQRGHDGPSRAADHAGRRLAAALVLSLALHAAAVLWLLGGPVSAGAAAVTPPKPPVALGIERAREILIAVNALGVPCASEALDLVTPDYLADLLAWTSIGARTAESQTHRQMASGLSMPVGFKNATDGSIAAAANAMLAAGQPHSFLGVSPDGRAAVVKTLGNPDRHVILRGGATGPNHGPEHVSAALRRVADQGIARPVMVDCSHGNSGKDPARQPGVCREVVAQVVAGEHGLLGFMVESNLEAGAQTWKPDGQLTRGVSITDACLGWDETEALLDEVAEAVRRTGA